ncbi:MAG: phage tail fiber protein [Planctomycetota bacterium]|jgi:hypothetical protein
MSDMSNFLENELFDHVLRNLAYTGPVTVYVALFTSDPGEAGGGTEVSGGAYARQAVTFTAPTDGAGDNNADITFPEATASWGTITHAAIFDALTVGNMLLYSPLAASKIIDTGDTFKFKTGDLDASFA